MFKFNASIFSLFICTVVLLTACSGIGNATQTPTSAPEGVTVVEPPGDPAQFTLIDQSGEELTRAAIEGKYTLFFFGFTHCPDFCPTTLANFVQVKQALGDQAEGVNFMFISVDGKRDTPARLTEYAETFDPDFIAATSGDDMMQNVVSQFGAQYTINDENGTLQEDYTVDHSVYSFLLDPAGRWVRLYTYGTPADSIAADIEQLLNSTPGNAASS